eukprot:CAMPEP_0114295916 /NCGR_PEP_ID=MMETSP0059-20121206/11027_1 /TAXON_ID=36894 /ORGANISM="Pyramimonas parkeae, Strain CCMP726" /LENGTH=212 /DNA_ID=CAMNT_0001418017 /DNA_START=189 /DNA_END=828 /DNA_ORIENTATION=-
MVNHLTCDELCFPEELWMRIASLSCDSFTQWARTWRCVCRRTNSLVWYRDNVREDFIVVPSILAPTVQRGVLLSARSNQKVLLLKPGIYREGVRITHNVLVVGLGHAGAAVVETAGWEAALTFAGLGAASCTYMGVDGTSTGEKATICNLTLQCRNQQQVHTIHKVGPAYYMAVYFIVFIVKSVSTTNSNGCVVELVYCLQHTVELVVCRDV